MTATAAPAPATVARALAEILAASNGAFHLTRARMVRELTARTGYAYTPAEARNAVYTAAPVLTETFGVYVTSVPRVDGRTGWRWRLSVRPPETPGDPRP